MGGVRRALPRGACALLAAAAAASSAQPADAAGLYFADRGVRPAGRAGAFIAGADDLGAIAYNPAGFFEAGSQLLIDASWLRFTSDYTRRSLVRQVDPNTGEPTGTDFLQTYPEVHGTSPILPIPTIAGSFQPHRQWVVAFGIWAPYAAIASYPEEVGGEPAPQRYSLITLDGSALAFIGVGAAFAPNDEWRLGAAIGVLAGTFKSTVVFSGCVPDRFFCAPEQPAWDVLSELTVGPIIAPAAEIGAIWIPTPEWRVGLSVQSPVYVRAPGTVHTRLPSASVFNQAKQVGDEVDVAFDLPWNVRVGVETRVVENLRAELGFGYERWGMHDEIVVDPDGVALEDVAGFPQRYELPDVHFPRNFQDSVSVRLGGEYALTIAGYRWDARAGVSFETSAIPEEYLTVLTMDAPKVTAALGLGLHLGKWRFDLAYAHVFGFDADVDPAEARATQVSPLVARPAERPNYINGGVYQARADVFGIGLAYTFEPAPASVVETAPAPAPAPAPKPRPAAKPAELTDQEAEAELEGKP
jgi:long-chain fatty acid transport protein